MTRARQPELRSLQQTLALGANLAANSFLAAIASSATSTAADAQVVQGISANATLASDYRFRGVSASDRNPVFQAGVNVSLSSGLYVGTWASQIADFRGSTVEIDLYGGINRRVVGFDVDIIDYAYVYPGGHNTNSFEGELIIGRNIGRIKAEAQLWLAPAQTNVATANTYLTASLTIPLNLEGLAAQIRAGHDNRAYDGKWDWGLGASLTRGRIKASVSYVDVRYHDRDPGSKISRAGLVAAVRFAL